MERTHLTPREMDVIHRVITGESQREIAQYLGIKPGTVKVHLRTLYKKLNSYGVNNMRKLMRWHTRLVLGRVA